MKLTYFLSILLLSAINSNIFADNYKLTDIEKTHMLNEADDWIDDMPDGLQNQLSDAVEHSLRGYSSELLTFRKQLPVASTEYPYVNVQDHSIEGQNLQIRIYRNGRKNKSSNIPMLIYFHGGGWTMGSINATDKFCKALVNEGGIEIVSVEYPLAPETDAAGMISSCAKAVNYISGHYKNQNISLGGDGAGGNLAIATYYYLKKSSPSLKIRSLLLYYPILRVKGDSDTDSWKDFSRGYGLDGRVMEAFSEAYITNENQEEYVTSPINLSDALLKRLPPTLIICSGRDILIDDQKSFVKRLKKCGVKISDVEFPGSIHGFITDKHQPTAFNKTLSISRLFLESEGR